MSLSLGIELTGQTTTLDRQMALVKDRRAMNEQVGFYAMRFVQDHLRAYNAGHANELGGNRTNFYNQCADSTSMVPDDHGASVLIAHVGIRLQYAGGTVKPGRTISRITGEPTKLLTIPNVAAAHGYRVAQWENLKIVWGRGREGGKPRPIGLADEGMTSGLSTSLSKPARNVLLEEMQKRWKGGGVMLAKDRLAMKLRLLGMPVKAERLTIIYWLVRQATIRPHSDVLPTARELMDHVSGKLRVWLLRH